MNYVINQGWVMYWGTARWSPVEIMEAYTNCRQFNCVTPIVEQAEYHLFCREKTELYMPELYNKIGVGEANATVDWIFEFKKTSCRFDGLVSNFHGFDTRKRR